MTTKVFIRTSCQIGDADNEGIACDYWLNYQLFDVDVRKLKKALLLIGCMLIDGVRRTKTETIYSLGTSDMAIDAIAVLRDAYEVCGGNTSELPVTLSKDVFAEGYPRECYDYPTENATLDVVFQEEDEPDDEES